MNFFMSIKWLIIAEEKKALYATILDNSISLAKTAIAFFFLFFFPFFFITLTLLAFVSFCFLYGITNVKGILSSLLWPISSE